MAFFVFVTDIGTYTTLPAGGLQTALVSEFFIVIALLHLKSLINSIVQTVAAHIGKEFLYFS